ncbi:hypothetical protein J4558_10715 [Leptolyngbya sp. 15MV]|nr:hypothetical protein J4558_10715 [Leptolyngbya sp. 15MV]
MGEMSFDFPPDLRRWIEEQVAAGHYADASDYVRDLILRDRLDRANEAAAEETPEYIAWVREKVAEGLASGVCDKDAFAVLDEIRAKREARRG